MRQYLMKAIQDDARRAGERDRLHLEAQRARLPRRPPADPTASVRRLARLLLRRRPPSTAGPCAGRPHARGLHAAIEQAWHEVLVDDEAAAEQASPPLALN